MTTKKKIRKQYATMTYCSQIESVANKDGAEFKFTGFNSEDRILILTVKIHDWRFKEIAEKMNNVLVSNRNIIQRRLHDFRDAANKD